MLRGWLMVNGGMDRCLLQEKFEGEGQPFTAIETSYFMADQMSVESPVAPQLPTYSLEAILWI